MTNPQHAAGNTEAPGSGGSRWEPRRWYLTIGGALTTVYANSQGEHDYRCAGCGKASERSEDHKAIQADANDHAGSCRAARDPRMEHASDIARAIISDVSAELPRIDAQAAAGIALSAALIVGLVSTQTPNTSPVFAAAVVGGVFLTLALLLFLAALLSERASVARGSVLRRVGHESGRALLAELAQWDRAVYYASVAVELSGAARAKARRLQLGICATALAVLSFVSGVGIYFLDGSS
jgi:hypothetical protein